MNDKLGIPKWYCIIGYQSRSENVMPYKTLKNILKNALVPYNL